MKDEKKLKLTMVIVPPIMLPPAITPQPTSFIIGKLEGGNKLTNPRIYTLFEDKTDGKQKQHMAPLPGWPTYLVVAGLPFYPILRDETTVLTYKLYEQVTTPRREGSVPAEGNPSLN